MGTLLLFPVAPIDFQTHTSASATPRSSIPASGPKMTRATSTRVALPPLTPEQAEDVMASILSDLQRAIEALPVGAGLRERIDAARPTRRRIKDAFGVLDGRTITALDNLGDALAITQGARRSPAYFARHAAAVAQTQAALPHFMALVCSARADLLAIPTRP